MTTRTTIQIDIDTAIRDARAARAALIRSFFSRIFSRRHKAAAPVSALGQTA